LAALKIKRPPLWNVRVEPAAASPSPVCRSIVFPELACMTLAVFPSVRARVLLPLIWGIIVRVVAAVVVSAKIVLATAFTVAPLTVSGLDPPIPVLPKVMLEEVSESEIAPKLVPAVNPT
jgi:hypothetical protein